MNRSVRVVSPQVSRQPSYLVDITGPSDATAHPNPYAASENTPLLAETSFNEPEEGPQSSTPTGAEDSKITRPVIIGEYPQCEGHDSSEVELGRAHRKASFFIGAQD